ncbi:hypothetical protein PYW07_003477 [Mythimna separata]|uniref:Cilia- and flagella-associated protein 157 n=1 Tax=Mythimna separata TaxID=271217 RepID=A0AAD7YJE5_MYTSE|nr:hypothetical protein PYW07_003477 [Mythimna separata]
MAPKKIRGAISGDQAKAAFSQVEKAFDELQFTDLNRKLARLRRTVVDYEIRNEELQTAYDKLDEDRADIIAYLKKTFTVKSAENAELKEKVKGLEELREVETAEFKETVNELERNFTRMKDQLSSENKLLAGKLNTLEEFRAIRDDLMKKFEKQERAYVEQEMYYRRIIYDTEKKFIIGKDKLKKEMEERLLQLAQQFQDGSELRIAASTHRVIRENIALNNQLDSLLMTQAKVAEQNEKFREDERAARCAKEVAEEERDKAMNKSTVQLKFIDKLTAAFEDLQKQKALNEKKQLDVERYKMKKQKLKKDNESLILQVRILEQNLHASLGEQNKSVVETAKLIREYKTFKNILKESECAVEAALQMDQWSTLDPSREIMDREIVLKKILGVISQYRKAARTESMESLVSLSKIYEKGDLGFEVKPVASKKLQIRVSGLETTASLQSFEDKRSAVLASSVSTSKESIKTMPNFELMPPDEESPATPVDSLPSFTVASFHSSRTSSSEHSGSVDSMTKLLARSKIEMQKSLMVDLVKFSTMSQRKLSMIGSKLEISSQKSDDNIKDDRPKTIPEGGEEEEDEGEHTGDTDETIEDTEITNDDGTDNTTQGTDEPTTESDEDQEDDVNDK